MSIKKFYSVKETAKILGVSTNTVYKYVDTGSLVVRRLGRGRIKIPYASLSLVADLGQSAPEGNSLPKQGVSELPTSFSGSQEIVSFGVNDIFFFRIFRGLTLLGLGIIYFISQREPFYLPNVLGLDTNQLLLHATPIVLLIAGVVSMFFDFRQKSSVQSRILMHIFNTFVFTFYVVSSWATGKYGEIVFILPLGILSASHIARGIFLTRKSNFYDEFLRYVLLLALFGGALIVSSASFFPIESMVPLVEANTPLFAFIWFFLFVPPMIYFLSPYGRNSRWIPLFFAIWSAVSFVVATKSIVYGRWDISYMSYLIAAFGIFFIFAFLLKLKVEFIKLKLFLYLFLWIGLSLIVGLMSIRSTQSRLIKSRANDVDRSLLQTGSQINYMFSSQRGVMTEYAGLPELVSGIEKGDSEVATYYAKLIFERTYPASRVIIYNADGRSVGVYPVSSLAQGADFSSRDYFLITKATYNSYITPIYESILGTDTILQTEPVFNNNKFAGLIGVAINLDSLAKSFDPVLPPGANLYLLDENNVVAYSTNENEKGKPFDKDKIKLLSSGGQSIVSQKDISLPRWQSYETVSHFPILSEISNLNINLTVLFVFNLVISFGSVFIATSLNPPDMFRGRLRAVG